MFTYAKPKSTYHDYHTNYLHLLDIINQISYVDAELLYRFIHLLSGYVKQYEEYELSTDLLQLSNFDSSTSKLTIDHLINKKTVHLKLIKWMLDYDNIKLNYLIKQ